MQINETMNLKELADRMGEGATEQDARNMRKLLNNDIEVRALATDTSEVPEELWVKLLDAACTY